ncbi:endolytic transglycosylase MltG [Agrococcus sp. SGAir0287]|uniref:endolytic transglycosylase MltG n=1 Tax=Agrococcus sp. SGAir0287 TaxID=2070347 RepID=UPI0010CD0856|nr:endolytic transglycosylase MltG [Agrococcus sp. SGAir0287]QCR19323.1 endolytic transglycosylase MltG [Agrococcus sp. SGAir0287]
MGRRGRPPGTPEPGSEPFGDASEPIEPAVPPTPPLRSTPAPEEPVDPPTVKQPVVPERPAASEREPTRASEAERTPASQPEPTFEDIFGTPTPDAPEPELPRAESRRSRPSEPVASEHATSSSRQDGPSAVDALADAVGASTSQTPWATATSASAPESPRAPRERAPRPEKARKAPRQRSGRRGGIVIIVALVAILAAVFGGGWLLFGPAIIDRFAEPADYEGAGTGEVVVRIEQGWTGAQVATMLEEEGVIADQEAFYDLLVADPSIGFQPGSYRLALEMSAQAALDALQDESSRVVLQVTIPEGFVIQQVFARLAEQTGIAEADIVQAASDPSAYGVPGSTLEGWLFPATYTFDGGTTAQQMLQAMVDRMRQALTDRGVPQDQWQEVVTFASLVEREGGPTTNFPQVARVFQNRLDIGMLLQSDATVHYGIGDFGVITTTDEERADANNPYNTYVYAGLPVGPIGAPGDAAIDAVLSPAEGDWLYFVTVDPSTGETVFSNTLAEHNQAVLRFQQWLRDNPEYGS